MTERGEVRLVRRWRPPSAGRLPWAAFARMGSGAFLDVAIVVAATVVAVGYRHWVEPGHEPTGWFVQLVISLPLLLRRRFPTEVLVVAVVAALAEFAFSGIPPGEVALLVALFSVGAYEQRVWALIGSLVAALVLGSIAVIVLSPTDAGLQTVVLLAGTVIASWVTGVYVRTRRAYLRSVLDRAATAERERDQQALTIRAEERNRLSREIHDIVAHSLSVMIALGDGATVALNRNPAAARAAIEQASVTGRQALDEIRRLLGALRDHDDLELGPQPGLADLDELVAHVRAADLPVTLTVTGQPPRMSAGAQLAVYRVVQEGLTNVLKHAPTATEARVELCVEDRSVTVTVSNDGVHRSGSFVAATGARSGCAGRAWPHRDAGAGGRAGWSRRCRAGRHGGLAAARRVRPAGRGGDGLVIRVLLVDDQPLLRQGFGLVLGGEDDLLVVGKAGDGIEAVRMARVTRPDVVLMDVRMPRRDGIEATREMVREVPDARVLILTTFDLDEYAFSGLAAGASGFLLKNVAPADLIAGIRSVARGDAIVAPRVTRRLLEEFAPRLAPATAPASVPRGFADLTVREREVFDHMVAGLSNLEIARALVLVDATVKTHVGHVLAKLRLRDRVQAVILAYESGMITRSGEER